MSAAVDMVPPHNLDAEKSLLGAMMLSADAAATGLGMVGSDDFYRSAHGRVYQAVEHLFSRGEPIDVVTVAARLEATGELEQTGGKGYLLDIVNTVPLAGNVAQYANIVKRTSLLRRLIQAATRIAALGYQAPDDVDELVEEAEKLIFDVTNERVEANFRPIDELLAEGWNKLEELYERQEHLTGVTTGYDEPERAPGRHAPGRPPDTRGASVGGQDGVRSQRRRERRPGRALPSASSASRCLRSSSSCASCRPNPVSIPSGCAPAGSPMPTGSR